MSVTEQDLRTKIEKAKAMGVSKEDASKLMHNQKQASVVDEVYGSEEYVDEFDTPAPVEEFTSTPIKPVGIPKKAANETATYGILAAGGSARDLPTQQATASELERLGTSSNIEKFLAVLQKREDDVVRGAVDMTLGDGSIPVDEKVDLVKALAESRRKVSKADFQKEAAAVLAINEPVKNPQEAGIKAKRKSKLEESFKADAQLTQYLVEEGWKISHTRGLKEKGFVGLMKTIGGGLSDITGKYTPLYAGLQSSSAWRGVHDDLYGEGPGIVKTFDTGAVLAKIRDDLYNKQGQERMDFARQVVESVKKNAGIMGFNSLIAEEMVNELTTRVMNDPDFGKPLAKVDFDKLSVLQYGIARPFIESGKYVQDKDMDASRWLSSISTMLDYADAGWVAKSGAKFFKTALHGTPAGTVIDAAPNSAADALAAGMQDPKIAEALGTTPQDIYEQMLPAIDGLPAKAMPDTVAEKIVEIKQKINDTISQVHYGVNYTDDEKVNALTSVQETLDNLTGGGYRQSISSLKINADGTGMEGNLVIGLNGNYGYGSVEDAVEGAKKVFGEDASYSLMWKNPESGLIEDVPAGADLSAGVEFFAKVKHQYQFDLGVMKADQLLFGDVTVSTGALRNAYTNDANARLSRFTNDVMIRAYSLNKKISGDFNKVVSDSFGKLSYDSKIRVMRKLEEGSEKIKNFAPDELVGFTAKEMESYYAIRAVQDATWLLEDRRLIAGLRAEGMKQIRFDNSGYIDYAKPYDKPTAKAQIRQAYDPVDNVIRQLSDEDIERLYSEGATLGKLKQAHRSEDTATKYVIITPSKGMKVWELPQHGVLSYLPGYMTRVHKENWYIDAIREVSEDGVARPSSVTVANASNRRDAQRAVDELNAKSDGKTRYDFRMDSAFKSPEDFDKLQWDLMKAEGRIKTGHRGDRLVNVSTGKVGKINDMVDSLMTSINVTAKHASHTDAITSLKIRAMNSYEHVFPRDDIGQRYWPDDVNKIKSDYEGDAADVEQARAFWEQVRVLERSENTGADHWRNTMVNLANKIEGFSDRLTAPEKGLVSKGIGYVAKPVGNAVLWARQHDPLSALNGLAFNVLILPKPIRHFFMGSTQHNFWYGLEPKYFGTGIAYKDYAALQMGMASIDRPELWKQSAPLAAKMMGMTVPEYKEFVKGFKNSGLVETITSHSFAREGMISLSHVMRGADVEGKVLGPIARGAGKATAALEKAGKYPMIALQKVGFSAGEYNNKAFSYLLARKRYKDANPNADLSSKTVQAKIAAQAEDLAFNMTPVGSFQYQRGWLRNATQFLSFQHKALLQLLPESVGGSRNLAASEKARVAAIQALMWGTRGLGTYEIWQGVRDQTGVEMTPEMQVALEDGMADYMLNQASQAVFEDTGEVAYGAMFAPAGGSTKAIKDLIYHGMEMNAPEFFFGASFSAMGRIRDTAKAIAFTTEIPDLEDPEKFKIALQQGATIIGQYNDYIKAQAAISMGAFVNKKGEPIVDAQYSEIFMKGLMGAFSKKEIDYQHYMETVYPRVSGEQKVKYWEEAAQMYYDRLTDVYIRFADERPENPDDLYYKRLENAVAMENTMKALLPAEDLFAVQTAFRQLLKRNVESGTDRLVNAMAKALGEGKYGSERDYFMNVIRNNKAFTEEQKAALEAAYDYAVESTEEYKKIEGIE